MSLFRDILHQIYCLYSVFDGAQKYIERFKRMAFHSRIMKLLNCYVQMFIDQFKIEYGSTC